MSGDYIIGWFTVQATVGPRIPLITARLRERYAAQDYETVAMGVVVLAVYLGIQFAFLHPWLFGR